MAFIVTALNWVLFSWFFWVILIGPLLISATLLRVEPHSSRAGDFEGWPLVFVVLAGAAAWWRWTIFFPTTVAGWTWLAGLYLGVGFVVALTKYIRMLLWFRDEAKALTDTMTPSERAELKDHFAKTYHYDGWKRHAIVTNTSITFDWKTAPLANWLVYWPYFLFGSVIDWVMDFGNNLVNLFKGLFARLAARFSVKL